MRSISRNVLLAALLTIGSVAYSQDFPVKPVRIVLGIGAGSGVDVVARIVGQRLSEMWGQPVVHDNRPGAGGIMGADLVAKAAPDGYTLHVCASTFAISGSIIRNLPFDPIRDFEPITKLAYRENVLVVNPALAAKSVKDLIVLAKAKPGQLSFGSGGGIGSGDHMSGELFNLTAGVKIVHIPYKSGPQVLTDVINGQVTLYFGALTVSLPMITAGKVKALATTGSHRLAALPDVQTFTEAGLPDFNPQVWYGMLAPHGTAQSILTKVASDIGRIVKSREIAERFAGMAVNSEVMTPSQFKSFLHAEIAKWAKVAKTARISMD